MPTLILTTLSIMIAAYALLAGMSYVNPSLQSRIEVSRILTSQFTAVHSAATAYRTENHGVRPSSIDEIAGYLNPSALDGLGNKTDRFKWTVGVSQSGHPLVCLTYAGGEQQDYGILQGFERFAIDIASQRRGVSLGKTCNAPPEILTVSGIAQHLNQTAESLSLRLEDID